MAINVLSFDSGLAKGGLTMQWSIPSGTFQAAMDAMMLTFGEFAAEYIE
jgi:hypothetical protein